MTKAKGAIWKYFGAMMMEEKGGQQAVSFSRMLGVILFFCCLAVWLVKAFSMSEVVGDVPNGMLYTLWGLIGIKGAKDVAKGFKGAP